MDRVAEVIRPAVEAAGLELDGVAISPAGKRRVVRVTVDLPEDQTGSLELDTVAEVSRGISDVLDPSDVLGGAPYVLEVSSPGVDRPLKEPRHWRRARTRLVRVPVGEQEITGRVTEVDDAGVTLDVDGTARHVGWDDLGTGRMQVEFTHDEDANGSEEA